MSVEAITIIGVYQSTASDTVYGFSITEEQPRIFPQNQIEKRKISVVKLPPTKTTRTKNDNNRTVDD